MVEGTRDRRRCEWDLNFISTDGYYLVKAVLGDQCKLGAVDHNCDIFRPFVSVGEKIDVEKNLGYMTELRRRLLSNDEKVDPLGRITFAAPQIRYADSGNIRRDVYIDGEAAAVFVINPNGDIYDLDFMLELKKNELVEFHSELSPAYVMYDKDSDIYYTKVNNLYDLFKEKDRFYPHVL